MSIGTGIFCLALGIVAGSYFIACGLEQLGKLIKEGLSVLDDE